MSEVTTRKKVVIKSEQLLDVYPLDSMVGDVLFRLLLFFSGKILYFYLTNRLKCKSQGEISFGRTCAYVIPNFITTLSIQESF